MRLMVLLVVKAKRFVNDGCENVCLNNRRDLSFSLRS